VKRGEAIARALGEELPAAALERDADHPTIPPGLEGLPCAAPGAPEEWSAVVKRCAREGWTVLPVGSGTHLAQEPRPRSVDVVLSTARTTGVTAFEAGDGTITARAGTRWEALEDTVRATHHLAPELPGAADVTLGGAIAAGTSGLDRLRHGPLRHQVLGITAVQGDGTIARSGGRVVKNVTGYDLHRLWCGSRGTLGVVLEATLRLYPRPAQEVVLERTVPDRAAALALAGPLLAAALQPIAFVLEGPLEGGPWSLALVLAGREELVASELELASGLLEPDRLHEGEAALRARAVLRAGEARGVLELATRPSRLAGLLETVAAAASRRGLTPTVRVHPGLGAAALVPPEGLEVAALGALAPDLTDGVARPRHAALQAPFPLQVTPAAGEMMQRLARALDPAGVFATGRFDDVL
jgi:glycolate oxidase FAD binding subunit